MTRRAALVASVALLAIYLVLSFGNDARGFLGTDTGGKVATLRAMDMHHDFDPDLGYWAQRWDPHGTLHPLYYTSHIGTRWVNVTTLPALLVAEPLYRAVGYRGALLLPMLGGVACALAAAALARRLGARDGGRLAFWLVGLASPVVVYALDFWEHTLGLAAMAWATVALVDVVQRRRPAWLGVGAGVLFGVAATMRTEALAFGAVATAIACLAMLRTRLVTAIAMGACVVAGLALPLLANQALEHAILGTSLRATRAEATVTTAGSSDSASRVKEAAITSVGATSAGDAPSLVLGAGVAIAVAVAAWRRDARLALFAAALLVARTAAGLDFVPGFLVAAPIGAVGIALGWRRGPPNPLVLAAALVALPLVWAVQFTGGAGPQWGGRYVLLSSFLAMVVGVVALADAPEVVRRALIGVSVLVTALGVAWMFQRTHDIASSARRLDAEPAPVLVSRVAHLVREGGAVHDLDRWLTAPTDADLRRVARVVDGAHVDRIAVVDLDGRRQPATIGSLRQDPASHSLRFLPGIRLRVWTYSRE